MSDLSSEIERRATQWMEAWIALDRATLEDCLADDFALIASAWPQRRMERAAWLATVDQYRCSAFTYAQVQVRGLTADIAVMSSIATQQAQLEGLDRSGSFWLSDVWRKEPDGAWRVCARYSSLPEGANASASTLDRLNQDR
ncbi:nuclear transport factor 2 family protein [Sphingomonas pruni]|uniref:nuclear transport factor 2 family protein n=1 Tax=Sphingomonas pruni TaxID=40683 RepID=UPI000A07A4C4|nr:nuclear transport factor 2 family protein [Sphingomonas pruni]